MSRQGRISLLALLICCVWTAQANAYVYWADESGIRRANVDGSSPGDPMLAQRGVGDLARDAEHLYWIAGNAIGRARLDGTQAKPTLVTLARKPSGLAVDDGRIYWIDPAAGTIGRAGLDGTDVDSGFISGLVTPLDVTVHRGHVYWTSHTGRIGRANLDGTGVNPALIEGTNGAYGLAVNDTHIYWTNSGSSTVGRASVDGTGVNQQFIRIRDNPVRLAVDDRHLVWAADSSVGAYGESSIWRANLDGTGATSLLGSLKAPRGVAVDEAPAHVAASASATTLHFGVQPLFTIGAPQSVTIASTGIDRDLVVDQVRLTGDDFVISRDTCTDSTLAVGATCSVAVRFAPGAAGDRHAVLSIAGNAPLEIALDGTAGALPQGPAGPAGAVGAAAVPAVRRLGLVVCRRRCADRAIEGATAFTAAGRATLTRKGKRYATGISDGAKLVLRARRQVRPGRYTLTLRAPGGITTRGTVRIS